MTESLALVVTTLLLGCVALFLMFWRILHPDQDWDSGTLSRIKASDIASMCVTLEGESICLGPAWLCAPLMLPYGWVHVSRREDYWEVMFTTHRDTTDRGLGMCKSVWFTEEGAPYMATYQIIDMHIARGDEREEVLNQIKNRLKMAFDKHIEKTS